MVSKSKRETELIGAKLGGLLKAGDTVILKGDLASGKTTFTKGIGKALFIDEVINSPTFNILKIYEGFHTLYHIDAYRLENNDYDLGLSEYIDEGVMVIEWPEYYEKYLPKEYIEVNFEYIDENTRNISFIGHGDRYKKMVEDLGC